MNETQKIATWLLTHCSTAQIPLGEYKSAAMVDEWLGKLQRGELIVVEAPKPKKPKAKS